MAGLVEPLVNGLLIAALAGAVFTDLRGRRISNRLTYPMMLFGLAANAAVGGWAGLASGAAGWLVGIALLAAPCALGAMGLGDLKLLAAIGALKGPYFVLLVALYGSLAGGVLALGYLLAARGLSSAARSITGRCVARPPTGSLRRAFMPYAPAIAAGAMLALLRMAAGPA